ncbi:Atxe2 family lasso peptide isopeptidase [Sphingobium yanoikuyae]|uniref:Atxe2 family lasso peptide isopeptidase n=1 Tax=Sphingobium yanoikuyae TaxID=13690 RepID=UPI0024315988|nr:Atxe2 family lasso peptide isopeptidase [Sphingobium yanoikuyae]
MRAILIGLAAAGTAVPAVSAQTTDRCKTLDWHHAHQALGARALTARDLVGLRDIGPVGEDNPASHVMSISPDRRWVAFQLRQADPDANDYCIGMAVLALDGSQEARFVDVGGDLILAPDGVETEPATAIGIPATITPRWSPDNRWFAFLKRVDGVTRVWRADLEGRRSLPISPEGVNVSDFRIVDARRVIIKVSSLPEAVDDESRTGFHYDERFVPMRSSIPILARNEARYWAVNIVTGVQQHASGADISLFRSQPIPITTSKRQCMLSRSPKAEGIFAATKLEMTCGHERVVCDKSTCEKSYGPLWTAGSKVRFMRREGWAQMTTAVYEWSPETGRVQRLYATNAMLADCQPRSPGEILCLREMSLRPRHLIALQLPSGRIREIADPNPEFAHLTVGTVERMRLTSNIGIPAFADVVLPVNYRLGQHYPLIVVQYQSRGFLRGGIGDEFPIQLFANNGFFVLSVQRPQPAGSLGTPKDAIDLDRLNLIDFADRRNVLSVIEQGVDALVARGVVNPGQVGITGLSDGSSTVQFAALNSSRFTAGIASGCCWEPGQTAWLGPAFSTRLAAIGWPDISVDAPSFWKRMSLTRNAKDVRFPLLFSATDDEFRIAVASFTALREAGKPTDLFVFPGEFHIKWQPAHRLAAYERSLDWFMFWFFGEMPSDPRRHAEAQRWSMMSKAHVSGDD